MLDRDPDISSKESHLGLIPGSYLLVNSLSGCKHLCANVFF